MWKLKLLKRIPLASHLCSMIWTGLCMRFTVGIAAGCKQQKLGLLHWGIIRGSNVLWLMTGRSPLSCGSVSGRLHGSSPSGRWELSGAEGEDELSARWGQVTSAVGRSRERLYIHTHQLLIAAQSHRLRWKNGQLISSVWLSAAFFFWSVNASAASRALRSAWDGMISCRRRSAGFLRLPWVRYLTLLRGFVRLRATLDGLTGNCNASFFYKSIQSVTTVVFIYLHQCSTMVRETCAVTNSL